MRRIGAVAVALVVALVGTACTDNDSNSSEDPVSGGVMIEALVRPDTEDPALADSVSERVLADHLYDGLTTWDPDSLATRPGLAQRWEASDDNKVWTFTLREARAANGESVSAGDVKSSLERVARKSAGSPYADLLSAVVGFPEYSNNDAIPALDGVKVVDPLTVRIELAQPAAEFDKLLANPAFSVVHRASADGALVGTGPFTISERPNADKIVMRRVEGSSAYLDRVELRYFNDVNAAYDAFTRAEVDWTPVSPERAGVAGEKYGTQLFRPSPRTSFIAFNTANPKLADPRFRQAIVRAVDRREMVDKMGLGDVRYLGGIVPEGVPGAQEGGCGPDCNHDTSEAQRLIKQVFGDAPPPPLTLDVAQGPPFVEAANQQLVADLAEIGVVVTVRSTPPGEYAAVTVRPDRELFQASWSAPYASPDAFLPPLFTSSSGANVFGLKDPAIDAKLVRAQTEDDATQRTRTFREIERDVMGQFPLVPLVQFTYNSVAHSDVRGLKPLPTGNFDISTVWLADRVADSPIPSS